VLLCVARGQAVNSYGSLFLKCGRRASAIRTGDVYTHPFAKALHRFLPNSGPREVPPPSDRIYFGVDHFWSQISSWIVSADPNRRLSRPILALWAKLCRDKPAIARDSSQT
jgi:hypothetical protein